MYELARDAARAGKEVPVGVVANPLNADGGALDVGVGTGAGDTGAGDLLVGAGWIDGRAVDEGDVDNWSGSGSGCVESPGGG